MKTNRKPSGVHPTLIDIVFCMLLIFLLPALLATTTSEEAKERSLPPISLAEMKDAADKVGMTKAKTAAITVAPGPVYHLDEAKMSLAEIKGCLKSRQPGEVEIRGDVHVPYGAITEVLGACQELGISSVTLTYKSK